MKKRKNIIISAITCMMSICLMMFGVYAASNPSVSISGQVSYSVHDAKVMVQGKINGTKEYPTDVDYKKPTNINNLTAGDKLTDSQNQFLNFTTGASLNDDANDNLGTWNFGNLNFYEDQDGIKTIKISLLVTNLSNYPVKATLTYSNSYDNVTVTANKLEAYLAKYDQDKNTDTDQSLLTNDDFVVELKVTDDSKNANANNFSMNIKVEKYVDPEATLDKITLKSNTELYNAYSSLEQFGVISSTSPQGLTDYYIAEIKQDATGEVVIPATYNGKAVVPGKVDALAAALLSGKTALEEFGAYLAVPGVTSVIISTGITEVQNIAFAMMIGLEKIQVPSSLMYHQGGTFVNCSALTTVALPYGTKDLTAYSLVAGENVTDFGMFSLCSSLQKFDISETVTVIGNGGFQACSNLTSIFLSDNLTSIGKVAFGASGLKNVKLPTGITTISESMFEECRELKEVTIPQNITKLEKCAFMDCPSLVEVDIQGVVVCESSVFAHCTSLTYIPKGLMDIPDTAFTECYSLTTLIIEDYTNFNIGNSSFSRCEGLKKVVIEEYSGLTSIGNYAFSDCTSLTSFTILLQEPPQIGSGVFGNSAVIYVPAECVETYKTASGWSQYASQIQAIA